MLLHRLLGREIQDSIPVEVGMTVKIPESMLDTPFENFFAYWVYNRQGLLPWGPEYWRQFGVDVKDSQLVFDSEQHRLLFLLRWS